MPSEDAIDHELRREYRDLPADDDAAPSADLDPMAMLDQLGARWSKDFAAYASGQPGPFRCVLCGQAPCTCQNCTATYVSWSGAESLCGMTLRDGECPRGGTGADHGRSQS
jgi:hypothetical protein